MKRVLGLLAGISCCAAAMADVDFVKQVAPVLEAKCLQCHSSGISKGETSLHNFDDLTKNEYVLPGKPDESHLIAIVTQQDGQAPQMPKEGDPLTPAEVGLLRQWITEGANWPDGVELREPSKADASWWSLQPLKPAAPGSTIDSLIAEQLRKQGLDFNPPADRRDLIRRVTYDLTGLPPSPAEVESFVNSTDPNAYEKLIDRLLQSPRYGERWGRHWLDVVRFGESNGFERNVLINDLWPFRDYVIESLNADKPFDDFIREHLAGDVISEDPDRVVGSAFLVAGPYDDVGNQDAEQAAQIRANTLDEMISSSSQAFLGLTIGCARCHDHKFDPILQEDYYSWYATFSGIRHGAVPLATSAAKKDRSTKLKPLNDHKTALEKDIAQHNTAILQRGKDRLAEYQKKWTREPVSRLGTTDTFDPVEAKFVRFVCDAQDENPNVSHEFRMDEFEVWTADDTPIDVASSANGGKATGRARVNKDFPGAYDAGNAIDRRIGTRFIASAGQLTVEFAKPATINRIFFHSAKGEQQTGRGEFRLVADYHIEASLDGKTWTKIIDGTDRKPVHDRARDFRLTRAETTNGDKAKLADLQRQLAEVKKQIAAVPGFSNVWIGKRSPADAAGPFHVFIGGSPQRKGHAVTAHSLTALKAVQKSSYDLPPEKPEADRRQALAEWIVAPDNPLTPRVLANRVWHNHFGTGIVATPNDFGYMGERPTHPQLLDHLAARLMSYGWKLKPLHREIMLSRAYRQSAAFKPAAARIDSDSRLLWRFPPRRLSAEEIRDSLLTISGKLDLKTGGPGFRLYEYLQDNVATYKPLEQHGPTTYRRAVYHQNARATVVDLMTEFDQPDCAFSSARRATTTTPLQALTMLNHSFTLDMAAALAVRIEDAADTPEAKITAAYELCFQRKPTPDETDACRKVFNQHGLAAVCRVLLNTSELISLR